MISKLMLMLLVAATMSVAVAPIVYPRDIESVKLSQDPKSFLKVGSYNYVAPDDKDLREVLKEVILVYNNENHEGMTHHMKAGKLYGGMKQVVAGLKYFIEFDMMPTKCPKTAHITMEDLDKCPVDKTKKIAAHRCKTNLLYQPWRGMRILSFHCEPQHWQ